MHRQTGQEAREREFPLDDQDYRRIQRLVAEHCGIVLSDNKRDMVYSRLARRLRKLQIRDFSTYLKLLVTDGGNEFGHFINALTTNLTAFFREPHHFDYVTQKLVPELAARKRSLRFWSAGCSTGKEPYSLAIAIREGLPHGDFDVRILATDLDTQVLATAEAGVYCEERLASVSQMRLQRWFQCGYGDLAGMARVKPDLRGMITFQPLNLLGPWPMRSQFDAIFCRNVVIYFDKATQAVLFNRFADMLTDGGCLFLGHSETLFKVCDRFELLGHTLYRKRK